MWLDVLKTRCCSQAVHVSNLSEAYVQSLKHVVDGATVAVAKILALTYFLPAPDVNNGDGDSHMQQNSNINKSNESGTAKRKQQRGQEAATKVEPRNRPGYLKRVWAAQTAAVGSDNATRLLALLAFICEQFRARVQHLARCMAVRPHSQSQLAACITRRG